MPPPGRVKGQGHARNGEGEMPHCYPECRAVDQSPDQLFSGCWNLMNPVVMHQRVVGRVCGGGAVGGEGSRGHLDEGASCFGMKEPID